MNTKEDICYVGVNEPRKVGLNIGWLSMVALNIFFAAVIYMFYAFGMGLCSGCDRDTLDRLHEFMHAISWSTFGVVVSAVLLSILFRRRDWVPEIIMFLAIPVMLVATLWVKQTGY